MINCCGGYWATQCCPHCRGAGTIARWVPWQWQWQQPLCPPYYCPPRPQIIYGGNARSDSTRARA